MNGFPAPQGSEPCGVVMAVQPKREVMMMKTVMRVLALAVFFYVGWFCNPIQFVIHDLASPGANNNAYSPYTTYQRCHPAEFNIPTNLSC